MQPYWLRVHLGAYALRAGSMLDTMNGSELIWLEDRL